MADKPLHQEPELENHEDLVNETPSMQQPEPEIKPGPSDGKDLVKKFQDELAESKEKYLRLYAEFENHRRRTAREKLEMIQGASEQLLKLLLPVADDFERAGKSMKETNSKESEGFFLIQNKFKKILEQSGIKVMEPAAGDDFNPDLHEAITQIPAPQESLKGKIVDVVERGYLLNDKVIRFAKVVTGA